MSLNISEIYFILSINLEVVAINAFTTVYPECQVTACFFFHVLQCIQSRIQQEGLQKKYSEEFSVKSKMLTALFFVPLDDVVKAFNELVDILPNDIIPVVDYFQDNFIGRPRRTKSKIRP